MLKIWKMAANFQNVYRCNVSFCSSVVLADVSEHNSNPALQVKTNYVLWSVLVFFFYLHDSGFRRASVWATSWEKCGCWWLVSRTKCGCCSSLKKKLLPSSPKKENKTKQQQQFFEPSNKTSSTTGSSATMFLVDMIWTQTPAHWHLKIPIKWYDSIYFVSLVEKKVQFHLWNCTKLSLVL